MRRESACNGKKHIQYALLLLGSLGVCVCTWPGLIFQKPSTAVDRLSVVQHVNKMIRWEIGKVLVGRGVLPQKNAVSIHVKSKLFLSIIIFLGS